MRLPRISPTGIAGPPAQEGLRVPAFTQVAEAGAQLGQALQTAGRRLSADELRNVRFEAALRNREEKANRNSVLRKSLFGLKDKAFGIQQEFLEDEEPWTLATRTQKSLQEASAGFASGITHEGDRDQFNLQAQALTNSLTSSARQIGIQKQRVQGLAEGQELANDILTRFAADPSIDDSDFAGGVDSFHQFNKGLEDAFLINKAERQKLNAQFDDRLGGIVQQQDETLAVESGSHGQMLQHLIRVQGGFYRIAPEDVPTVIEQAIARQSKFLNAQELAEGKAVTAREKQFSIALDLQDAATASKILGRPVLPIEFDTNMKGLALEAFRKGIINEPATVNAAESEIAELDAALLDVDKAQFTELLLKATTVREVDELIDELIAPEMKVTWNQVKGGPAGRRELLKEAAALKDKFITEGEDFDATTKKEIQLAEASLNAKRETGVFGAFGTKATNEKIALMKRLLHLKVKQGQRPFDALADLEKQFPKTPGKAAAKALAEDRVDPDTIPFDARVRLLNESSLLTENQFDDQELKELIRFRDGFIKKTQAFVTMGQQETNARLEKERIAREENENSLSNKLKQFFTGTE